MTTPGPVACAAGGPNFITSVLSTMYFLSHSFGSYSSFTCEAAGTTFGASRGVTARVFIGPFY
jgi:hypothetical protein